MENNNISKNQSKQQENRGKQSESMEIKWNNVVIPESMESNGKQRRPMKINGNVRIPTKISENNEKHRKVYNGNQWITTETTGNQGKTMQIGS